MNNKKPKPKKKINLQNELKLLSQTFDLQLQQESPIKEKKEMFMIKEDP